MASLPGICRHNCKQLFILGGDGAHKGALQLGTARVLARSRFGFRGGGGEGGPDGESSPGLLEIRR